MKFGIALHTDILLPSPSARKVWIEIDRTTYIELLDTSPSARKVWIDKVNEYFEYCVTFCKWIQFHRFDKEAPPPFRGDFAM